MTRTRRPRYAALALALLGFACGNPPSAPNGVEESVMVSLAGLTSDASGVVLELAGGVEIVESARGSLEVAWAGDPARSVTVAIVGPLAPGDDVLVVRRRAGLPPLRVQVREIAGVDGAVASPSSVRATIRGAD